MSAEPMQVNEGSASYSAAAEAQDVLSGYKRTEVGVIPDDWKAIPLGSLVRLQGGYAFRSEDFSDVGVRVIRISDIQNGVVNVDGAICHPLIQLPDDFVIHQGDILVAMSGATTGKVGLYCHPRTAYQNQRVGRFVVRDKNQTSQNFVAQLVRSSLFVSRLSVFLEQGAQPNVSGRQIESLVFAVPREPTEQRSIAEVLSNMDGVIAALDKLIAKKRAIKQAALQQLLTGKTRLPGFSGEWETKRLGDHVTFLRNGVNSRAELTADGIVKYLHYGDIHTSNQVRLEPLAVAMPSLPEERARTLDRLRDGDLVFVDASEDLDGVGKSVEISGVSDIEVVAGLHTIAARFDKSVLADGFKAYLQFCPAFREQLRRLAAGTKVYATNRSHIASVEIRLPHAEEQTAIATVLSDMNAEIAALEARRDKTKLIKQGMMHQLLTGRVRLVKPGDEQH